MAINPGNEVVERFREHVDELAQTLYEGRVEQAFFFSGTWLSNKLPLTPRSLTSKLLS